MSVLTLEFTFFYNLVTKQSANLFVLFAVTTVDSGKKAMEVLGLNDEKVESPSLNVSWFFVSYFIKLLFVSSFLSSMSLDLSTISIVIRPGCLSHCSKKFKYCTSITYNH